MSVTRCHGNANQMPETLHKNYTLTHAHTYTHIYIYIQYVCIYTLAHSIEERKKKDKL